MSRIVALKKKIMAYVILLLVLCYFNMLFVLFQITPFLWSLHLLHVADHMRSKTLLLVLEAKNRMALKTYSISPGWFSWIQHPHPRENMAEEKNHTNCSTGNSLTEVCPSCTRNVADSQRGGGDMSTCRCHLWYVPYEFTSLCWYC